MSHLEWLDIRQSWIRKFVAQAFCDGLCLTLDILAPLERVMPAILGVQSLQDVCMERFCLHLSELAISSDRILAEQTPQEAISAVSEPERPGRNEAEGPGQNVATQEDLRQAEKSLEAQQATISNGTSQPHQDGIVCQSSKQQVSQQATKPEPVQQESVQSAQQEVAEESHWDIGPDHGESLEQHGRSDDAHGCKNGTSVTTDQQEIGERGVTASEQEAGTDTPRTTELSLPEIPAGQKSRKYEEQQQEVRTYLLRNVPPCFFEQLVHKTLTIVNKHFYNPK